MSAPVKDEPAVHLPAAQKTMATLLVMAATMLVVLDSTIANVAIPHMQAALGATPDTVSWVLTSYITATAVGTPITGWLAGRFGRSRLFWVSILGFTIASMLCGLAQSLPISKALTIDATIDGNKVIGGKSALATNGGTAVVGASSQTTIAEDFTAYTLGATWRSGRWSATWA